MKNGLVVLIGRPNVGKSTLLNNLINQKIAIVSDKPQTTRHIITGSYQDEEANITLVDTPGIHKPKNLLGKYLNNKTYYYLNKAQLVLWVVDITKPLGVGDKFIINKLKEVKQPVLLLLNKIDQIKKPFILTKIEQYQPLMDFKEIIPISALKNDNLITLIKIIKKYLINQPKTTNEVISLSLELILSELIREEALRLTKEEVPHALICLIDKIEKKTKLTNIYATIVVDRDSLKKIIIGKGGQMIKEIGSNARITIEDYLKQKVYLELYVKTITKWRDKEKYFSEFNL